MANGKDNSISTSDVPRRRGRPAGKNRVPLSREERLARNAQYERERREETAEAMSQLAEAIGCDPNITNADLLATAIYQIQRAADYSDDISDLVRINANLESQIATLQARLGLDEAGFELLENSESVSPNVSAQGTSRTGKRKRPSTGNVPNKKRIKIDPDKSSRHVVDQSVVPPQQPSVANEDAENITFDLLTDAEKRLLWEVIEREFLGTRDGSSSVYDIQTSIPINPTADLFPDLL